ncbi:MAG: endonuclease III [Methylotenera sp.]|nr:endonuclease III [Oligoflexia bacterium]
MPKPESACRKVSREHELKRMEQILQIFKREYSEASCSLDFTNPFELLVATILSAQCTDARVNKVTPALFAKYPTPQTMAAAKLKDIEKMVQSTGFFRNKSLSIQGASKKIMIDYGGEVPKTLEQLVELPGVGRKTANVLLGNAFDTPGLVVDTHVGRLCRRTGFTEHTDAVKVEHEMMGFVPREDWTLFSHLLICHGRAICTSRRAFCEKCPVARFCPKVGVTLRDTLAAEDNV